jgi:hypothetical protein
MVWHDGTRADIDGTSRFERPVVEPFAVRPDGGVVTMFDFDRAHWIRIC